MAATQHAAFSQGGLAIITGGASGIGLAMATTCALEHKMHVLVVDVNGPALSSAAAAVAGKGGKIATHEMDVASAEAWKNLREKVTNDAFGLGVNLTVLHLNAGTMKPNSFKDESVGVFGDVLATNLLGVTNGICTFLDMMKTSDDKTSSGPIKAIVITGSKQGITNPPGNPAYNCSKAAVRSVAEQLSYSLSIDKAYISVHLLVPGWTFTGMTSGGKSEKPAGAWTPEQVIKYLQDKMARGSFYVLCPDNDVDEATDRRRVLWSTGDLVQDRPPLSRWREDGGWKNRAQEGIAKLNPEAFNM